MSQKSKGDQILENLTSLSKSLKSLDIRIGTLEESLKPSEPSEPPDTGEHQHWKAEAILESDCPECKTEIEKLKTLGKKELRKKYAPFECVGCGLGVFEREEKCPGCGETKAKRKG